MSFENFLIVKGFLVLFQLEVEHVFEFGMCTLGDWCHWIIASMMVVFALADIIQRFSDFPTNFTGGIFSSSSPHY